MISQSSSYLTRPLLQLLNAWTSPIKELLRITEKHFYRPNALPVTQTTLSKN